MGRGSTVGRTRESLFCLFWGLVFMFQFVVHKNGAVREKKQLSEKARCVDLDPMVFAKLTKSIDPSVLELGTRLKIHVYIALSPSVNFFQIPSCLYSEPSFIAAVSDGSK